MKYTYNTKGTCSKVIEFELEGNIVHNVKFYGGCPGNLTAIPRLVEGMTVEDVVKKCGKVDCAGRGTSCADQLANAVLQAYNKEN